MQRKILGLGLMVAALLGGAAAAWQFWPKAKLSDAAFAAAYEAPLSPIEGRPRVYFLGHSLIGRDLPAMFAALSGSDWNSQLGWGASLNNHWTGEVPGFNEENLPPVWRPAGEAADSGEYPVVVLTEMVELKDAIRYHDSARALGDWVARFRKARPDARIYLYETWHRSDDPAGFLNRIDADLKPLWQGELMQAAMARPEVGTIYLIPGGQVLAAAIRAAEAGELPGLSGANDFLSDEIHLSDLGVELMALTHYAVIMGKEPSHLRRGLTRADGTPATGLTAENRDALAALVWQIVTQYRETGLSR